MTKESRKMKITDNIHSLTQQLFQLIQQQEIEIIINQQTIQYRNTTKRPQHRIQKKPENMIEKIITKVKLAIKGQQVVRQYQELTKKTWNWWTQQFSKNYCYFYLGQHVDIQNLYMDKTKWLFNNTILQQLESFVKKNNLSTQARAIYRIHAVFQDQPEILLDKAMDTVTINQWGKITNAQFEKLQTQIIQIILEKKIQEIVQEEELEKLGKIQPLTWKKTRIESPIAPSYYYTLGSAINITLASASTSNELSKEEEEEESEDQEFTYQNPILENPEFGTPNIQTQQKNPEIKIPNIQAPQNQNSEVINQHLPPVIVINQPPVEPIGQPIQTPNQ
ncbi:hypothetical protein G9A89_011229 [Geosiphon pyriformis]|nr:hypothetical protein G9A89_011229 [Geosiphon pyriformis]